MAEITERLVADYEQQIEDLQGRVNDLAADLLEARSRIREVEAERESAIGNGVTLAASLREILEEVDRQRAEALKSLSLANVALEAAEDDRDEARAQIARLAAQVQRVRALCDNQFAWNDGPYREAFRQALDGAS